MSNIAYITTRKHVKSYDITSLLSQINDKRFDGKLTIIQEDEGSWLIKYLGKWDSFDNLYIYQDSPRKLHIKHPHHPWMSYVFVVFNEELGAATNAVLSDEGIDETFKPNPQNYPTYQAWVEILHPNMKEKNPDYFKEHLKFEMSLVPKGMEKY